MKIFYFQNNVKIIPVPLKRVFLSTSCQQESPRKPNKLNISTWLRNVERTSGFPYAKHCIEIK